MSDAYVECLVKAKKSMGGTLLKYLLVGLTVLAVGLALITGNVLILIAGVAFGVGAYFVNMYSDVEYEYLYLDRELSIEKILAKTKRKKVATYQLDRIEILAPIKSYHLDNYKNRTATEKDYSIGIEEKPDLRYVMYYEGGEKVILSPSPEMIKLMKSVSPRKIFND